jgi:hypothetical protein
VSGPFRGYFRLYSHSAMIDASPVSKAVIVRTILIGSGLTRYGAVDMRRSARAILTMAPD